MSLMASEIARRVDGVIFGDERAVVEAFDFDSRRLTAGACFVALQGNRDGHDFVDAAYGAGARAVLVARPPSAVPSGRAAIVVPDPLVALQILARRKRAEFRTRAVVGVAGSVGKTSTKDLLAAALAPEARVFASPESFNNEFGVPYAILAAPADTDVLVVELGERRLGDLELLCGIARPTIGVVTNVGLAHAEHLGGMRGATEAMLELVRALPRAGLLVLNADDRSTTELAGEAHCEVVRVGTSSSADVRLDRLDLDSSLRPTFSIGDCRVAVPLRGAQQAQNAAMAMVVAERLGVSIGRAAVALEQASPAPLRMQLLEGRDGVIVLNDAYNANPASMTAALHSLAALKVTGRRIAVIGDMCELGNHAHDAHSEVGALAAALAIDVVIAVGEHAEIVAEAATGVSVRRVVADAATAATLVVGLVSASDSVLVKGSRAVGLEVVAEALLARTGTVLDQEVAP